MPSTALASSVPYSSGSGACSSVASASTGTRRALHLRWSAVAAQRLQGAAQNAHDPVGTFRITSEPEQIVGHPALNDALRALHARRLDGRLPQAAVRRHLAVGDDPHIARARLRCAQRHRQIGYDCHGEAARHYGKAFGGPGHKKTDGERLRDKSARGDAGVVPKPMRSLGDQHLAVQLDLLLERPALRFGEAGSELAVLRPRRPAGSFLRRPNDHAIEIVDDVAAIARISKPAARSVGNQQVPRRTACGRWPAGKARGRGSAPPAEPSALRTSCGALRHTCTSPGGPP